MINNALAIAFMRYLLDPTLANIEAAVVALEGRRDLPITPDQLRKAMVDNIDEVKRHLAGNAGIEASNLLQRLLTRGKE